TAGELESSRHDVGGEIKASVQIDVPGLGTSKSRVQRGGNADDTFIVASPEKIDTRRGRDVSNLERLRYTATFHQLNVKNARGSRRSKQCQRVFRCEQRFIRRNLFFDRARKFAHLFDSARGKRLLYKFDIELKGFVIKVDRLLHGITLVRVDSQHDLFSKLFAKFYEAFNIFFEVLPQFYFEYSESVLYVFPRFTQRFIYILDADGY